MHLLKKVAISISHFCNNGRLTSDVLTFSIQQFHFTRTLPFKLEPYHMLPKGNYWINLIRMELYKEICLSESCKSCFTIDTISEVLSILAVKNLTCLIVHTLVISFMLSDVFASVFKVFCLIFVTHFIWLNQGCLRLNFVSVYSRIWNAFKYSDYFWIWYFLRKLNRERWQLYCYRFRHVCWGLLHVSNTISFFYKPLLYME